MAWEGEGIPGGDLQGSGRRAESFAWAERLVRNWYHRPMQTEHRHGDHLWMFFYDCLCPVNVFSQ